MLKQMEILTLRMDMVRAHLNEHQEIYEKLRKGVKLLAESMENARYGI